MQPQEPLSVFRKPEPAPAPRIPAISPRKRLTLSRALAAVSAAVLLAVVAADLVSPTPAKSSVPQEPQPRSAWLEIPRASGAFDLSSPLLSGIEQSHMTRRNRTGNGRKDIITFGAPADAAVPFVRVSIYRPGSEGAVSIDPVEAVAAEALDARIDAEMKGPAGEVLTKFGGLTTVDMQLTTANRSRNCLAASGKFDAAGLGLVIWYCNPGEEIVAVGQLACLLDRLSLVTSGRDEKLIDFFAKAELNRSFCDARNTLYGNAPRHNAPDWLDSKAIPVLRGKISAR
ncbi:MAG: hypothetical protein KIT15_00915 [Xanthobacteraceae bacterium]|nr:hypothetical protein [Xanthobacteraceae bacterium]